MACLTAVSLHTRTCKWTRLPALPGRTPLRPALARPAANLQASRARLSCAAAAQPDNSPPDMFRRPEDMGSYDSDDDSGELRATVAELENIDSNAERVKQMRIWSLMHGGGAVLTTKVTRNLSAIKQIATRKSRNKARRNRTQLE
eukprot:jgi/Tetstr1/453086/TSEL_040121.t1